MTASLSSRLCRRYEWDVMDIWASPGRQRDQNRNRRAAGGERGRARLSPPMSQTSEPSPTGPGQEDPFVTSEPRSRERGRARLSSPSSQVEKQGSLVVILKPDFGERGRVCDRRCAPPQVSTGRSSYSRSNRVAGPGT